MEHSIRLIVSTSESSQSASSKCQSCRTRAPKPNHCNDCNKLRLIHSWTISLMYAFFVWNQTPSLHFIATATTTATEIAFAIAIVHRFCYSTTRNFAAISIYCNLHFVLLTRSGIYFKTFNDNKWAESLKFHLIVLIVMPPLFTWFGLK